MNPTPQKQSRSRRWTIVIILFVLFLIVTSQFPLLEILPDLWGAVSGLAVKYLGILFQSLHSLF